MKFKHFFWWQVSDDEQNIEIHSEVTLWIFRKEIVLSKRSFELPCHFIDEERNE